MTPKVLFQAPIFAAFLLLFSPVFLSGCDNSASTQPTQSVGLESPSGQPQNLTENQPQPVPANTVAPPVLIEQSGTPAVAVPQPTKIYTFHGNVLLPPNIYLDKANASDSVNNVNICGVLSLDAKDNQQQKYCYKLSELHNRLYDADHIALDVWDVRDNSYLLLTKSADGAATDAVNKQQELWVDKGQFGVYHPYADITQQKLLFLGDWDYQNPPTWPLQAYDGPDGKVIELKKENYPTIKSTSPMVTIVSVAQSPKNELWFRLNLINSLCETQTNPQQPIAPVIMNVWYPAYRVIGNLRIPTVWYSAKGC